MDEGGSTPLDTVLKGLRKGSARVEERVVGDPRPAHTWPRMSAQGARSHRANPARYHINTYHVEILPPEEGLCWLPQGCKLRSTYGVTPSQIDEPESNAMTRETRFG